MVMSQNNELAKIKPFEYQDMVTGHKIRIEVSPYYSKLIINTRVYYFIKETGEFHVTSMPMEGG